MKTKTKTGYQYHSVGNECWLTSRGEPKEKAKAKLPFWLLDTPDWETYMSYELDPPSNGRNLCQYMADESEETGMRAYTGK